MTVDAWMLNGFIHHSLPLLPPHVLRHVLLM